MVTCTVGGTIRILRDRQREQRDGADHYHQDGEHVRENGPLDEKSEIMRRRYLPPAAAVRRGGDRLQLRIDLLAGNGPENSGYDDAVLGLEPALDHAQLALWVR